MKKGAKLMEDGYLLQITDLQGYPQENAGSFRSLRQAVEYAAKEVPGMDNYLKVYRDFTAQQGAYVAVFVKPSDKPSAKPEHIMVRIRSFAVYTDEGIQNALDYLKRISEAETKVGRKRSPSR